jgi:hypothetical protein
MRAASPGMQPALTTLYRGWLLPSTLLTCWDLGESWMNLNSFCITDMNAFRYSLGASLSAGGGGEGG